MAVQRAPAPLVSIDVAVDPFRAHAGLLCQLQTSGNLFRTPVLAQESLDLLPGLPGNARTIGRALPVVSEFIRLVVAIAFLPTVASQLARNGALMATEQCGNASLVVAGFLQDVYLVSLFPGKLFIVHGVLLLTWRLIKHAH